MSEVYISLSVTTMSSRFENHKFSSSPRLLTVFDLLHCVQCTVTKKYDRLILPVCRGHCSEGRRSAEIPDTRMACRSVKAHRMI